MSWSLNIGRVAGTVVRVHLTFLLFLAWIFAASYSQGGAATAWDSVLFMVLLFLCVLLHEFGHIFTARAFGVPTPYVTLLPIGGVAQLERIPEEPGQEFLIAIAGPLVNVVITILLVFAGGATLQTNAAAGLDNMHIPLIDRLAAVNLFLALFNMIPAFPMDGGRVLRAAVWRARKSRAAATGAASIVGLLLAAALVVTGVALAVTGRAWQDAWYVLIGAFLLRQGWLQLADSRFTERLERVRVGDVMDAPDAGDLPDDGFSLASSATALDAVTAFRASDRNQRSSREVIHDPRSPERGNIPARSGTEARQDYASGIRKGQSRARPNAGASAEAPKLASAEWTRSSLSPLWGWIGRTPTHGLRRGLHSYAASRLQQLYCCCRNLTAADRTLRGVP